MSRNLTDALSKLFIKLGGKTSDSKENKGPVDYIDDITSIVEPGGENTKPLFVKFDLGNNLLSSDEINITSSESLDDIINAYLSGRPVIGSTINNNSSQPEADLSIIPLTCYSNNDGQKYVGFNVLSPSPSQFSALSISGFITDNIEEWTAAIFYVTGT